MCPQGRTEFSMEKLVDDVVGVIRHLGHEKCILVGHGAPTYACIKTMCHQPGWLP